jgi:5-methylcytosine-specific restriction endonuclease McrA
LRKRYKKEKGTYRKRCRKYGGHYNAEVTRSKVFERDGYVCHVCHKKAKRRWANNHPMEATLDHHPIPLSRGGDHDWHNVRCAHRKCNSEKSDKWDGQRRLTLTD